MKSRCIIIGLILLLSVGGCEKKEPEINGPEKRSEEAEKEEVAYTFLLKKVQKDNCNLIASKDDKNLSLIQDIIQTNKFNIEVEDYNNTELGPDLCHYSKSTKNVVTIIDVTKRDEKSYYISYYMGPEGGASKEIHLEERNGKWAIVNDDGMWNVK
ncbi:MAG: hypothetical protein ACYS67_10960 [Planctomycetota bacterium]|jgi:hypothetical protein